MKIIIFTGKFGMGHYSVTKALLQDFEDNGIDADISVVDIYEYLLPSLNNAVYKTFNFAVRKTPRLYNTLNRACEHTEKMPFKSFFVKKMSELVSEINPDVVVSTLPVAANYFSAYKEKTGSRIPLITFITDIVPHASWITKTTDYYFVGCDEVRQNLIRRGVAENKIIISGIPVRREFRKTGVHKKRDGSKKEILVMGGGLGLIPYSDTLLQRLNSCVNINATVITGSNKALCRHIKNKYKNIKVLGFTENVCELLSSCDLLISKSGGVTIFEAIYTCTPMLIIDPFLEQEIGNAEFMINRRMGIVMPEKKNACDKIMELIEDPHALLEMKNNMNSLRLSLPYYTTICDLIGSGKAWSRQ